MIGARHSEEDTLSGSAGGFGNTLLNRRKWDADQEVTDVNASSQSGKNLFKEWEGLVLHEYPDSGGAPTIGIGHLLIRSERTSGKIVIVEQTLDYRDGLTEQQCWDLLDQDLDVAERAVDEAVTVVLNQNQFDALVSFTFNVGEGAFRGSTLLKLLNQGQYNEVPAQLRRWVRDNGQIVQGLVNRREKEITLWNTPV